MTTETFQAQAHLVDLRQLIPAQATPSTTEAITPAALEAHIRFAQALAARWHLGHATSVTWLNHVSAQTALGGYGSAVAQMDFVGVDGIFLKRLVGEQHRTSADLVVPELLQLVSGARVLLIGGTPASIADAASSVTSRFPGVTVVGAVDGYAGLPRGAALMNLLHTTSADVILLGLGAGLQEEIAGEIKSFMPRGLVLTCGGFLDQIQQDAYYPAWAYPLRLNWAVRLAREPRRLWRRYSIDALRALRIARRLRTQIDGLPGYCNMQEMFGEAVNKTMDFKTRLGLQEPSNVLA